MGDRGASMMHEVVRALPVIVSSPCLHSVQRRLPGQCVKSEELPGDLLAHREFAIQGCHTRGEMIPGTELSVTLGATV